ncbi:MAG: thioredoxin domain-containing protein [Acidobacteria bacterium]|nr:thioredoxin domain-containing protein [Acidobacteriota bacterium]
MAKETKSKSGTPIALIAIVLLVVLIGGIWFYGSSSTTNTPAANQANQTKPSAVNIPPGASLGVNMIGAPDAAVTVEEFADYQCGACASAHPAMKELQGAYAGNKNFRFIFRHYPLGISGHDKSYEASVATEAAGLQGKFWQMQDKLFTNQQAWTSNQNYRQMWVEYAGSVGMDVEKFKTDIAGIQTKERVDQDMQRGRAMAISSTPTVLINGNPVPFNQLNITTLRQLVDAEIQKATAAKAASDTAAQPASNANSNSATNSNTASNAK